MIKWFNKICITLHAPAICPICLSPVAAGNFKQHMKDSDGCRDPTDRMYKLAFRDAVTNKKETQDFFQKMKILLNKYSKKIPEHDLKIIRTPLSGKIICCALAMINY